MKESGVCHQNGNRKWKSELSVFKQIVQFVLIFVVCFWLLYQIHQIHTRDCDCDEIESNLRNKQIARLLGRKGGLNSYDSDEGSNARGQVEGSSSIEQEQENPWRNFGEFLTKESEIGEKLQELKESTSTEEDQDENDIAGRNKTEEEILIDIGAVILKNADKKFEVFRVHEDDGVSRHDSGPSRRSNLQTESSGKANASRFENVSKEMDKCKVLCSKKLAQKKSSEGKGSDVGVKNIAVFESGHAGMRELLHTYR